MAPEPAPQALDNLLLDIGADTGALIIYTGAERDGTEIEISPADDPGARTHNVVRARRTPASACHAAVFPALQAGNFIIWHGPVTSAATVTVHGGRVTSHRLTAAPAPGDGS